MVSQQVATASLPQHEVAKVDKLVAAGLKVEVSRTINCCTVVSADGMPLCWAARQFVEGLTERVSGVNLIADRVERAVQRDRRLFWPGAHDDVPRQRTRRVMWRQDRTRLLHLSDP